MEQYDVIYGSWPQNYDEVVLVVDQNNEVSDLVLYTLGLRTEDELTSSLEAYMNGETVDAEVQSWSYEDLCGLTFKLVGYYDKYVFDDSTGTYTDVSGTDAGLEYLYDNDDIGVELKISGIVRQNADAVAGMMSGAIGYTSALTDYVISRLPGQRRHRRPVRQPGRRRHNRPALRHRRRARAQPGGDKVPRWTTTSPA